MTPNSCSRRPGEDLAELPRGLDPGAGAARADLSFPPEWEPHEAVWMGWSDDADHHPVQVAMIRAMAPHARVRLMVVSDSARAHAEEALQEAGVEPGDVDYVVHEIPNFCTRDPGPLFLSDGRSLAVATFRWDDFGYPNDLRVSHDPRMLRRGEIGGDNAAEMGLPVVATELVAAGERSTSGQTR